MPFARHGSTTGIAAERDSKRREHEMNPIQLIKQDHRTVRGLFRRFANADHHADKQRLAQEIIEELSVHAALEEQLIYPLLEARGRQTQEKVFDALEEHHVVKLVLAELEGLSADSERFDAKMHVIQESVESHIEEEESKLLPRLDAMLDAEDRKMLAASFIEMKQTAPTHPHPNAPDSQPAAMIAGLVAKITDAGKDMMRRIANSDRAAGHRAVQRRASAAAKRSRPQRRKRPSNARASRGRAAGTRKKRKTTKKAGPRRR
jgi:hemerythrin superfamily protein